MVQIKAVIVDSGMITPYGMGIDACWKGLLSRSSAIKPFKRFNTDPAQMYTAGIVPSLEYNGSDSLVMQLLSRLFPKPLKNIQKNTDLIFATLVGEVEILERYVQTGEGRAEDSCPDRLARKARTLIGVSGKETVISAACASSSSAIAQGASLISSGESESVIIVTADSVSEFIFSGFSSLMSIDKEKARPFDKNRKGLSLGEAAGFLLLMSEERASSEKRTIYGKIAGRGMSNDAHHMTAPSEDGSGLAESMRKAIRAAGLSIEDIGSISAHGTGTVQNDAMEMQAFKSVFGNSSPIPTYSIKGGIGHTMGATGLIEVLVALKSLDDGLAPPTVNLLEAEEDAKEWVSKDTQKIDQKAALSTNAGFGGINSALVITK